MSQSPDRAGERSATDDRRPPIARFFGDAWVDGEALAQLERVASLPGCVRAVGLPDLHAGPSGKPVGVALAFEDLLYPGLIGSDVGCGVRVVVTAVRRPSLDRLERRVRAALDEPPPWEGVPGILDSILARGIAGLADLEALPASLRRLAALETPEVPLDAASLPASLLAPELAESLGTIGGGNHFAEIGFVSKTVSEDAREVGCLADRLAVMVHSGSRGLGAAVAEAFSAGAISELDARPFLAAQAWANRFARANRWLLTYGLLVACEAARPEKHALAIDVAHNEIQPRTIGGRLLWVHRKGAAPSEKCRLTVVLGSRGAPSWILRGDGSPASLESVAHGAGRRMRREEALGKMRNKYSRASLSRTAIGSRVICDRPEALYEEHPDAYKPIGPVIDTIARAGLATPVATLTPLVTVKR